MPSRTLMLLTLISNVILPLRIAATSSDKFQYYFVSSSLSKNIQTVTVFLESEHSHGLIINDLKDRKKHE